eukprot:10475185-Lingulodinium_polyedra.AAC.1
MPTKPCRLTGSPLSGSIVPGGTTAIADPRAIATKPKRHPTKRPTPRGPRGRGCCHRVVDEDA